MTRNKKTVIKIGNVEKTIAGWAEYVGRYSSGFYNYRRRHGDDALASYIKKLVDQKRKGKLAQRSATTYRGKTFSEWEKELGLTRNYLYSFAWGKSRKEAQKIIDGLKKGKLEIKQNGRGKQIVKTS